MCTLLLLLILFVLSSSYSSMIYTIIKYDFACMLAMYLFTVAAI